MKYFFLIQDIINVVTNRLSDSPRPFENLYGIRLLHTPPDEMHWLQSDSAMFQVLEKFDYYPVEEWR